MSVEIIRASRSPLSTPLPASYYPSAVKLQAKVLNLLVIKRTIQLALWLCVRVGGAGSAS